MFISFRIDLGVGFFLVFCFEVCLFVFFFWVLGRVFGFVGERVFVFSGCRWTVRLSAVLLSLVRWFLF